MCNLNVRIILTFPFARGVDIFRQQKLDPRQQFKNFACGLVSSSCTFYGTQITDWHSSSTGATRTAYGVAICSSRNVSTTRTKRLKTSNRRVS